MRRMYGIFTHSWLKFMANVGKYTIHGADANGGKVMFVVLAAIIIAVL